VGEAWFSGMKDQLRLIVFLKTPTQQIYFDKKDLIKLMGFCWILTVFYLGSRINLYFLTKSG
jgi:hypothetical protein